MPARRLVGDPSPKRVALRFREPVAERRHEDLCSGARTAARQPHDRKPHHLANRARIEVARRTREQLLGIAGGLRKQPLVRRLLGRQVAERTLCRGELPALEQHPDALPDVSHREPALRDHLFGEHRAALRQLLRLEPHCLCFAIGAIVAARKARRPRMAADLEVILHQRREFEVERLPFGAFSEFLEPVRAQSVGQVAAGIAVQELVRFAGGELFDP